MIVNDGSERKNLRGWEIHDYGRDHTYRVPRRLVLKPGERFFLYSGRGQDFAATSINGTSHTTHYWHWDRRRGVWDNDRDQATLVHRNGSVADGCSYGQSADSPKRCWRP